MTADAVRELVQREIAGDWCRTNAHGCELRRCLVRPELREYDDCAAGRPLAEPPPVDRLWLVLEETSGSRDSYKIVYDERADIFGLAVPGSNSLDVFIGYYGGFLDTYRGM